MINYFSNQRKFITGNRCEKSLHPQNHQNTIQNLFDENINRFSSINPSQMDQEVMLEFQES
jgi:hypothetical protein